MSQTLDPQAGHPAEGIHLPKPSAMPLVWAAGFMLVAFGIILGGPPFAGTTIPQGYALSAVGLLVILAATSGWLIGNVRERIHASETPAVAAKFAMWCFLGTEVVIFGALIARVVSLWLVDRSAHTVLTASPSSPLILGVNSSLLLVSLNTFLLLVSSLCVVLGLSSIEAGNRNRLVLWLVATAVLGAAFVSIQGFEFSKLVGEKVVFGNSQFASAFYFLTGNHGLHVIIGVLWCLVVVVRALRGGFTPEEHLGVEIFGLYWHFVDVVWIIIFTVVYLI
jgi:heme/copper-type cytochrome/quinol oxidase subunit 3